MEAAVTAGGGEFGALAEAFKARHFHPKRLQSM